MAEAHRRDFVRIPSPASLRRPEPLEKHLEAGLSRALVERPRGQRIRRCPMPPRTSSRISPRCSEPLLAVPDHRLGPGCSVGRPRVRFGSQTDTPRCPHHVRFTPDSSRLADEMACSHHGRRALTSRLVASRATSRQARPLRYPKWLRRRQIALRAYCRFAIASISA